MKFVHRNLKRFIPVVQFSFLFLITACSVNKKTFKYFQNLQDGNIQTDIPVPVFFIQANDQLAITITSKNPEAAVPFNLPAAAAGAPAGYLVAKDGYIEMPVLGLVKVAGYTTDFLRDSLTNRLKNNRLLVEPAVSVRLLSFKVTVLGEVTRPSVLNIPTQKVSLVDALAMAGDLTPTGRRDNILIIRDNGTQKISKRINLNSLELFHSDFYYLRTNDVVYVEPTKAKIITSTTRTPQWIGLAISAVTFIVGVATFSRQK